MRIDNSPVLRYNTIQLAAVAELADLIKIKYRIQRIKALTCVGAVAKIDK